MCSERIILLSKPHMSNDYVFELLDFKQDPENLCLLNTGKYAVKTNCCCVNKEFCLLIVFFFILSLFAIMLILIIQFGKYYLLIYLKFSSNELLFIGNPLSWASLSEMNRRQIFALH